ncbi:LIM and senescent cell antigen-like-containing domain protein 2 isoform X4 [Orcinus orca]|nr:LIM and senescent cell antigen-like-containing domain protein 2 isoform X4 [Orcinus orca]XP_033256049.2 LIM and senescent cell antigen-like-containing domain protein 2 isoform X4 [Orcinus orca]XP_049568136.1 LIM and senescent cell antigen-like-containing domain protein 2 isoform X4 [Orcinus orca]
MSNALANAVCQRCQARFAPAERIVNSNGELYHEHCFVCAQCFRPFPDGLFYELEGRKYCEHDFQMLFAPCCRTCGEFIIGRVIKAMNNNWHPGCFRCELCDVELADLGFVKNAGRHLCRPCHNREKAKGLGKYVCQRCHLVIDEQPLMFRNDAYHPDHFSCTHCGKELTAEARELKGELYCLPCHDKMGVPICGACRRPIEGRVVNALGKQWHVEVCPRDPADLSPQAMAGQAHRLPPSPSWPSRGFQSHENTLGTLARGALWDCGWRKWLRVRPTCRRGAQVCPTGCPGTLTPAPGALMALGTPPGREACKPVTGPALCPTVSALGGLLARVLARPPAPRGRVNPHTPRPPRAEGVPGDSGPVEVCTRGRRCNPPRPGHLAGPNTGAEGAPWARGGCSATGHQGRSGVC